MKEMVISNADTINSQTLLQMVNEARKLCGEKPVRNNDFIAKVKDELDGETYEIFVGQKNGAEIEIVSMTYKQALRVAARESKAVRRSLIDQLEELQQKALAAPQQQTQLIPGTPEHFAACYRAYFGEPVLPSLTAQQQHTEPVQALPPVGEHHACPANKISLNKMKDYVSNERLLRMLIEGFGLEGELFDPGCVKGTNQAARPYVVYNKSQVMAMLKAAQCLSEKQANGKRKLLGRDFSIRNVIAATSYDSIDFDAACEMIILMKATTC